MEGSDLSVVVPWGCRKERDGKDVRVGKTPISLNDFSQTTNLAATRVCVGLPPWRSRMNRQ